MSVGTEKSWVGVEPPERLVRCQTWQFGIDPRPASGHPTYIPKLLRFSILYCGSSELPPGRPVGGQPSLNVYTPQSLVRELRILGDRLTERRRLFFDIETAGIPVRVWDLNSKSNAHISHENIIPGIPWGIICICWKWAGQRNVESLEWDSRQSDRRVVAGMIAQLDQATEIVMHNGNRFDLPWVRGRAIYHSLPMRPHYVTLDTLTKSRGKFRFPSHRLDFLGQHLVGEQKIPTTYRLWKSIVDDKSPAGMAKMVRYCKQDVRLLEKVFDRMAPYFEPVTHVGSRPGDCPECGQSDRVIVKGYRTRVSGAVYVQMLCKRCPKWFGMPKNRLLKNKDF